MLSQFFLFIPEFIPMDHRNLILHTPQEMVLPTSLKVPKRRDLLLLVSVVFGELLLSEIMLKFLVARV
jgi:hypothetical protein